LVDSNIWFNVSLKIDGMNDTSSDPFVYLSALSARNSKVVISWRVEIETDQPRERYVQFESWNISGGRFGFHAFVFCLCCFDGEEREEEEREEEEGGRRQETGDRRQETGDRRQETGDRRQERREKYVLFV
jgi:hypothetical protein